MKATVVVAFMLGAAAAAVVPRGMFCTTWALFPNAVPDKVSGQKIGTADTNGRFFLFLLAKAIDSDEAVVYPAQVDQSWVDARRFSNV